MSEHWPWSSWERKPYLAFSTGTWHCAVFDSCIFWSKNIRGFIRKLLKWGGGSKNNFWEGPLFMALSLTSPKRSNPEDLRLWSLYECECSCLFASKCSAIGWRPMRVYPSLPPKSAKRGSSYMPLTWAQVLWKIHVFDCRSSTVSSQVCNNVVSC